MRNILNSNKDILRNQNWCFFQYWISVKYIQIMYNYFINSVRQNINLQKMDIMSFQKKHIKIEKKIIFYLSRKNENQ